MNIYDILNVKAKATAKAINASTGSSPSSFDLIPQSVSLTMNAFVARLHEDGSFFLVTGVKEKPAGISLEEIQLVFLFKPGTDYGVFIPKDQIIDIIKKERSSLKIGIDEEYKNMGVWMNLGILTSFLSDDFYEFLSALPRPS